MSDRKRFSGKKIAFLWRTSVDGFSHFMVTAEPVTPKTEPSSWRLIGIVPGESRKMITSCELGVCMSSGLLRGVLVSAETIGRNKLYRAIKL